MEMGEVLYSNEKGVSIPIVAGMILINVVIAIFFPSLFILEGGVSIFIVLPIIMVFATSLMTYAMYKMLRGMDFRIHENGIWINVGRFFKQRGELDQVEIHHKDIKRIILLNKVLNIYWKDPVDSKIKRSFILIGKRKIKDIKGIYRTMNRGKGGVRWRGPRIHNLGKREKEKINWRNNILIFFAITIFPSFLLASFITVIISNNIDFSVFTLQIFLMFFIMFFIPFLIILFPFRLRDIKEYKFHGDHFSVIGGNPGKSYTEYKFEDIESIEKAKAIPMVTPWNPWRYKFFRNQYSAKNSWEIYYIKFKDDYRLFEMGEYIKMKDKHPSKVREFQYLTIPAHIIEYFKKKGADI